MLTFALLMSARMGIFQETLYKQYGKHSKEALFYNVSFLCSPACRAHPETAWEMSLSWQSCLSPFSLRSTAYLCQASCFSPQTSTTTVSTSIKAVSPIEHRVIQEMLWMESFIFCPAQDAKKKTTDIRIIVYLQQNNQKQTQPKKKSQPHYGDSRWCREWICCEKQTKATKQRRVRSRGYTEVCTVKQI